MKEKVKILKQVKVNFHKVKRESTLGCQNDKKEKIKNILKNLPKSPGIYQFFDKNEKIIYVGKSVNLKSRVNSYFNSKTKLNFAKQKMLSQIENIEIILVNNETESLILETNLIKKHKPKYNILMKDDKNHIYIKITNEKFPKIIKTRIGPSNKKDNGTFFGPYLSSAYVENILKLLKKIFGYGVAENHFFVSKKSYNLDKYLFKGAEIKQNFEEEYFKKIEQIKNFLKQDFKKIIPELEEQMKNFAKNLEFERAGKVKADIESIKSLEINQLARENISGDYDVINYLEKYEKIFIGVIKIRESKIISMQNFEIENNLEESLEEVLEFFVEKNLLSEYLSLSLNEKGREKFPVLIFPDKIPHPSPLLKERECLDNVGNEYFHSKKEKVGNECIRSLQENGENFEDSEINSEGQNREEYSEKVLLLQEKDLGGGFQKFFKIEFPKIGPKKEILNLCYKNIYEFAYKKHLASLSTKNFTKQNMINLLNILGYKQINKNIIFECNDISHHSGNHTVASRSVIENGKIATNKYKKYRIKTLEQQKINDFDSMREVFSRRLREIFNTGEIPDLIIIDGGKGQLGSVVEVLFSPLAPLLGEERENWKNPVSFLSDEIPHPSPLLKERGISEKVGNECFHSLQENEKNFDGFLSSQEGQDNKKVLLLQEKDLGGGILSQIQIVSIAKREEELFVFRNGKFEKFVLEKNSLELRMIQKIRDEAHRFAITFNRDSRIKSMKKNILESLPGFGPVTRKKILKKYGNVENLSNFSVEELSKDLNKNQIKTLEEHGII